MVSDRFRDLLGNVLFWGGTIGLFLWALGKSLGIIHSPNWVEMLPYFTFSIALTGGGVKVGKTLEKIDNIDKRVTSLEKRLDSLEKRLNNLCIAIIKIGKDVREIQRKAFCLNDAKCSKR